MSKPTIADQLHLAGQIEQARIDGKPVEWQYHSDANYRWVDAIKTATPVTFLSCGYKIRLKPALKQVPLGPEDVLPGSVLRFPCSPPGVFISICGNYCDGVAITVVEDLHNTTQTEYLTFRDMQKGWLINSSIPLTGKWDPNAWTACCKTVEEVPV